MSSPTLIPPDLVGVAASARAQWNLDESQLIGECLRYCLLQVADGATTGATLAEALHGHATGMRLLHERVARAILLAEKSLADQAALLDSLRPCPPSP